MIIINERSFNFLMRLVEGATALEESWYVTPPACFTRAGPVNVETSPLEDLLIEHPSMSVYRATTASPVAPDTPPPTPDATEERDFEEDVTPPARTSDLSTVSIEHGLRRSEDNDTLSRPAIHDGRPANNRTNSDKVRVIQLRSAQKVPIYYHFRLFMLTGTIFDLVDPKVRHVHRLQTVNRNGYHLFFSFFFSLNYDFYYRNLVRTKN